MGREIHETLKAGNLFLRKYNMLATQKKSIVTDKEFYTEFSWLS
jgi:hypothetical protein